jgi:hypothetical protein
MTEYETELLAEAFDAGELQTYVDKHGQVALRVCATWNRVRELLESLRVKDPASVYTVHIHTGWTTWSSPLDHKGHDQWMARASDDCTECGGMGHTIGFGSGKKRSYPCESCGVA